MDDRGPKKKRHGISLKRLSYSIFHRYLNLEKLSIMTIISDRYCAECRLSNDIRYRVQFGRKAHARNPQRQRIFAQLSRNGRLKGVSKSTFLTSREVFSNTFFVLTICTCRYSMNVSLNLLSFSQVKELQWRNSTLLVFLRSQGAAVCAIKPEYLLEPEDYYCWMNLMKKEEKTTGGDGSVGSIIWKQRWFTKDLGLFFFFLAELEGTRKKSQ